MGVPALSPMYFSALSVAFWSLRSLKSCGSGTRAVTLVTMPGLVPQVTCGAIFSAWSSMVMSNFAPSSLRNCFLKRFAARDERPAFEIREGGFIRRDHAGARAAFDGHVADGHAPVHGKGANGFAAVFGDVAVAAGDARFPDDGKNQVLCRNASGAFSMHQNVERLGARLNETLRRKHMLDFAGADAKSQRAERAVGGGMTVAANKGLAGLGDAEFRADDVHDALVLAVHVEEADAGFTAIFLEGIELQFGVVVENRQRAVGGRDGMVHHRESEIGAANLAAFRAETGEGLGRGALVYEVAVNVDDGGLPGLLANDVGVPDLLIERLP